MRREREVEMDTIEARPQTVTTLLRELPLRLHHNAYVVKDHEANRRFLEDLLGIPLVATWCEKSKNAETGDEIEFCHTFFGLADGSALRSSNSPTRRCTRRRRQRSRPRSAATIISR